jgi:hypothetical protein
MRKNERIGLRVPADLKRALIQIARKEGRSLAQVCEVLLRDGVFCYAEDGHKYLHRLLSRQKKESAEQP